MTTPPDAEKILEAIRAKYGKVARTAMGVFKYATGRTGAIALGYEPATLESVPADLLESFCGVGNPFRLGPLDSGETVLDVGCGVGVDLLVAARKVGPTGRACGIDVTEPMLERARHGLDRTGTTNAEVRPGSSEAIPYDDGTFDVVISNGVLNLSVRKDTTFREIRRVLRPGGRLHLADIVLVRELPGKEAGSLEAWSD